MMARRSMKDYSGRIDHLTAYHLAIDLVKKAGFTLAHVSMNSESCYYSHPARHPLTLRLSTHRNKSPIGLSNVVAKMTFSARDLYLTPTQVRNMVTWAVGSYFVRDPAPSRYHGKRGTWEAITKATTLRQEGMFEV